VAGSTHPGEEEEVLAAYQILRQRFAQLTLVLAPRHPERGAEVAQQVRDRGLPVVRRTAFGDGTEGHNRQAVIVLDTVGELADLYGLADLVFVGGSLVPMGGHNMLEPAQRRKPVLFGPHTQNFRDGAELLRSAGAAVVVRDTHELAREAERLLKDPVVRQTMGEAGYTAVASQQGAVAGTMKLIERHLITSGAR
jgi:3-deoxy-D-manno-octulosonic-acid transferase